MDAHTSEKLKRGIDLQNRLWGDTTVHAQKLFRWWKGGKVNFLTYLLIGILTLMHFYMASPVLFRDVSPSFASAAFLQVFAKFFTFLGVSQSVFFGSIVAVSLFVAVASFYLSVRRIAHRHELTAFFATLVFLMPNPFFHNRPPLIFALMHGDGAHMIAFAWMPVVFVLMQLFINTSQGKWLFTSVIGTATIALISPFAFFNLIIIGFILAVSEGFVGEMRLKLLRFSFILVLSFGLSLFWYYPHVLKNFTTHGSLFVAFQKVWYYFPILIPAVPVAGTIAFLVFDRRPKLKPIFMGVSIFTVYASLYYISSATNANGIFIADRYFIEMYYALSFLIPLIFIFIFEISYQKVRSLLAKEHKGIYFGILSCTTSLFAFIALLFISNVQEVRAEVHMEPIIKSSVGGLGNMSRVFIFSDVGSNIALLISIAIAFFLIFLAQRMRFGIQS